MPILTVLFWFPFCQKSCLRNWNEFCRVTLRTKFGTLQFWWLFLKLTHVMFLNPTFHSYLCFFHNSIFFVIFLSLNAPSLEVYLDRVLPRYISYMTRVFAQFLQHTTYAMLKYIKVKNLFQVVFICSVHKYSKWILTVYLKALLTEQNRS